MLVFLGQLMLALLVDFGLLLLAIGWLLEGA